MRVPAIVLVLLAFTLTGGVLRGMAAGDPPPKLSADEKAYGRIALNLANNGWVYGAPKMKKPEHWAPGAPVAFAVATTIADPDRRARAATVPAGRAVNAAAGTVMIPLAFGIAALLAGPVAGLLAAAGVAFYPPLISSAGTQLSEPLGAMFLLAGVFALAWAWRRRNPWLMLLAGVLFGLCVLTRADLLLAPVAAAAVVALGLIRPAGWRRALGLGALVVLGWLLMVVPWSAYATARADRLAPVSAGGAGTLFLGTFLPGEGTLLGAKRALEDEVHREFPETRRTRAFYLSATQVLDTVAEREPGLERDDALMEQSRRNLDVYALGRPLDFGAMMLDKSWRLWGGIFKAGDHTPKEWAYRAHWFLCGLGLLGLLAGLVLTRHPLLWAALAILAYSTLNNMVLVAEPRHNVPLVPLLVTAGAAGLGLAWRWRRDRGRPPDAAPDPPGEQATAEHTAVARPAPLGAVRAG